MPFSWRVFTNSFSSFPVSTPGVTVLLLKTLCKNVQIKVETEHKGEGLELKECIDVALSFWRTYVDCPQILTGWDLEGGKPLA